MKQVSLFVMAAVLSVAAAGVSAAPVATVKSQSETISSSSFFRFCWPWQPLCTGYKGS